jgi:prophage regulatory protein
MTTTPPRKPRTILCLKEVTKNTSLSKPNIYRLLKEGRETGLELFPVPIQVSKGRIGWHQAEIDAWIASRPRAGAVTIAPPAPKP